MSEGKNFFGKITSYISNKSSGESKKTTEVVSFMIGNKIDQKNWQRVIKNAPILGSSPTTEDVKKSIAYLIDINKQLNNETLTETISFLDHELQQYIQLADLVDTKKDELRDKPYEEITGLKGAAQNKEEEEKGVNAIFAHIDIQMQNLKLKDQAKQLVAQHVNTTFEKLKDMPINNEDTNLLK